MMGMLAILFLLLPRPALAADHPAETAVSLLQTPLDARPVAMGSAFTAVADDLSALYYNPAGLALLKDRQAGLSYLKGLDDQNVEHVSGAVPLAYGGVSGMGYATAAAALSFAQNGSIEVNRTNPDGSFRDTRTLSAGSDLVVQSAYAERLTQTQIDFPASTNIDHFIGGGVKIIRSTLAETYSATAFAADLGYLARAKDLNLTIGLAALNAGTRVKYSSESDPLPLTVRFGTAYGLPWERLKGLTLAGDVEELPYERRMYGNLGLEYVFLEQFAGRLGYQINRDVAGLTFGVGIRQGPISFDYGFALASAISDSHRLTIAYRFGGLTEAQRSQGQDRELDRRKAYWEQKPKPGSTRQPPPRPRPKKEEQEQGAPGWIY